MIKIPITQDGIPAIERCLADGLNINITLLFGVENYEQVAWAYVSALEKRWAAGKPINRIPSVASFFVSRVDTLTDKKLEERIAKAGIEKERNELKSLLGKAGIANAKIAYAKYNEIFSGTRWKVLADGGARVQRCLWASTSTKNPNYRDVMYAEGLIGPDTINTMPQTTLDAFRDHGVVAPTLVKDVDEAFATIQRLEAVGIDFKAVTDELQVEGVRLFSESFAKANESIKQKRDALVATGARRYLALPNTASAATGDVGYQDQSFSGTGTPTGTKRAESVLWWNDGSWWADMWSTSAQDFHIFRLNLSTQTWSDTGVTIDTRSNTHADVLWDGGHLYVASHEFVADETAATSGSPSYLFRFSYNTTTKTYSPDSGFPVQINNMKTETLVIDKDSTGKVWATWQQNNTIYLNRTLNGDDRLWGAPFALPNAAASVTVDDNSALIAFGGNKMGIMWSNQGS